MRLSRILRQWFWYGYFAGLVCGLVDTFWSWHSLEQFLPGVSGRILATLYLLGLYGFFGALVSTLARLLGHGVFHGTRFGQMWTSFSTRHSQTRERNPADGLLPLSLALAWTGLFLPAVVASYLMGLHTITNRNHKGLVVVVIIVATLGAIALTLTLGLFLARLIEGILRKLLTPRAQKFLSRLPVAALLCLVIIISAGMLLLTYQWELVSQLRPRPALVAAAFVLLLGATAFIGKRVGARLPQERGKLSAVLVVSALVLALLLVLSIGSSESVRKGNTAHTGLGGILTEGIKRLGDLDGDGFSSLLGGGDCAPFQGNIYPGAVDIPGDGIDQDCSGEDTSVYRRGGDAGFVPVPKEIKGNENILFLSIDAVRADHVSAYGYGRKTTPTIDAIAAKGVLFENAWAHAPSTRYSIPAIITGRHPSQVLWNMSMWWPGLKSDNNTIAEVLKSRGLTTGALLSYHYFDPKRLINQGFDHYDNSLARLHRGRNPASTAGSSAAQLADKAIDYLGKNRQKRFFLWVHFYDPHYEYEKHPGTPEFGQEPVDLYDHEILFTDAQIARVLDKLQELGLSEKTIIVFTSDHGTGFGEHGIKHHGYHLYGAQTRVPLIIYVPGLPPRRIKSPTGHVDLLPTLANLTGAEPSPTMFGRSLVGPLTGSDSTDRVVFQEVIYEGPTERWAAITDTWHLIYNMIPDNTFELYDLQNDREENHDLWGKVEVEQLKQSLLEWINVGKFPPETYARLATAVLKQAPTPKMPLSADFEGKVWLEGLDLEKTEVKPGGKIELTWYFKSLKAMAPGHRIFVHFRGKGRYFTADHQPVDGALPFEAWTRGQWIADWHSVDVPESAAPGEYELTMGIYRGRRRMEVKVSPEQEAGNNAVRVGTIRVVR